MENPGALLRRAEQNRRLKAVLPRPEMPAQEAERMAPAPRHVSSHASYTALMRSHDRMHTRHIAGRDGA